MLTSAIALMIAEKADAHIVWASDRPSIRNLAIGRGTKPYHSIPNAKGPTIVCEGYENVLADMLLADPSVEYILAQPLRVQVGRKKGFAYIPDFLTVDCRSMVTIWELKTAADRRRKDPTYLAKLDIAQEVFDREGWRFRMVVLEDFDPEVIEVSAAISRNRGWLLDRALVENILDELRYGQVARLSILVGHADDYTVGLATVLELVRLRKIGFDVRVPLRRDPNFTLCVPEANLQSWV